MQRPGFNTQCDGYNYARWGYCVNCQNQRCQLKDSDDADAAIGIGLKGSKQSTELGAGWTQLFASGPGKCTPGTPNGVSKRVWISVRKTTEIHGKEIKLDLYRDSIL